MQGTRGRGSKAALITAAALCVWAAIAASASAATPPSISATTVTKVTSTSVLFEAKVNPQGKATTYHFEYGPSDCTPGTCTQLAEEEAGSGSSEVTVKTPLEGLTPATIYHYRVIAKNSDGETTNGPDRIFATYATLFEGLPDGRAYEQASPVDKDGGDAVGQQSSVKASANGSGITFGSTFGIPGGKGAQALPTYLATRGGSDWTTQGMLPPVDTGERAKVIGWTPDHTETFSEATRLGDPRTKALIVQSSATGAVTVIAPYTVKAEYAYAGSSPDGSVVFFETKVKLAGVPEALEGLPNLYAWDRASGELHLAGATNEEEAPPKGAFGGPYDWSSGTTGITLKEGGAALSYYLQDERAITPAGDIYFTEAATGQLYLRENPTKAQSPLNGQGECEDHSLACTVHVSATHKDNGTGEGGTDPVGPQPAAFQAASADGSEVFFTSPEKLTNDANTGPEQPKAAIGTSSATTGAIENAQFIPQAAVGVTVDGSHVYWANPALGEIGRADLNGTNVKPDFITIPEGTCEEEFAPGEFKDVPVPSTPRYVAVDAGHIYWTNTGRVGEFGPLDGGGSIGRAKLNGETVEDVDPDFICGEEEAQPGKFLVSNPQGIAVNATHIYWANAAQSSVNRSIARAAIGGGGVEGKFVKVGDFNGSVPYGVALSATHLYYIFNDQLNDGGYISRVLLEGGAQEIHGIGEAGLRGVAVDAGHVYWATQGEGGAIGRADLELKNKENEFSKPAGKLNGLAVDANHLYWAANGESATNPGSDLYRFEAPTGPGPGTLTDLTPDSALGDTNGAEVQGVLGVSGDGTYVYFAANGVLAPGAVKGDCKGPVKSAKGKCSLYAWHDGAISFVARLDAGNGRIPDSVNWVGSPREVFNSGSYFVKTSFLSEDGQTLLFRSREKLSPYDNEGTPELYRYQAGEGTIRCASCRPSGEAAAGGPSMEPIVFPGVEPPDSVNAVSSRNLSADGNHAFFETAEALSPADTNGAGGCPPTGTGPQSFPSCLDVYEWEAPSPTGSCKEAGPSYSPLNGGCLFLISTGKDKFPSLFADASASGNDVFFFTRQGLVGQDKDELQDVYDAKVGGGLASQNQIPALPCLSPEACHGPAQAPPVESTPATPTFVGPGDPKPVHKKQKAKKKQKHKKQKKKNHRANAKGRNAR